MWRRALMIVLVISALAVSACFAGLRGPGKYCGVVLFDRWGGCTLYSGIYVMYVSEAVKEALREKSGQCVQIDATEVYQPMNPGDGLIQKFKLLGPAPEGNQWESPKGLRLSAKPAFEKGPAFVIRVENTTDKPATLVMDNLAPTVLTKITIPGAAPDGPSFALVTRNSFCVDEDGPRLNDGGVSWGQKWEWKVTKPATFQRNIELKPGEAFEVCIAFKLPEGEYEFIAGYGGGVHASQCIASGLIAFNVAADHGATLVKIAGR